MRSLPFLLLGVVVPGAALLGMAGTHTYRSILESRDVPQAPEGMVAVPAGYFLFGTDDPTAGEDERPQRRKFLSAFYIDAYEVTNAEFQAFKLAHSFAPGRENFPATGIPLAEARAYAASIGKRLPTLAEWEKAARGTDGRDYTWGNEFRDDVANIGAGKDLAEIGQFPNSASPYGAHDMIGNAWEWVDDVHFDGGFFSTGGSRIEREIIKGGAFSYAAFQGRASYNGYESVGMTCNDVGFRCVEDLPPTAP